MAKDASITLHNVNKWFGKLHVLQDISLSVAPGERVVVCGPSGSGKSTMIRCINRLEKHESGEIRVNNVLLDNKTGKHSGSAKRNWYGLPAVQSVSAFDCIA